MMLSIAEKRDSTLKPNTYFKNIFSKRKYACEILILQSPVYIQTYWRNRKKKFFQQILLKSDTSLKLQNTMISNYIYTIIGKI